MQHLIEPSTPPPAFELDRTIRLRLPYLDGLRGLAALYIVFHHAELILRFYFDPHGRSLAPYPVLKLLEFGHYSVALFIVLSGYCLMMPVADSVSGQLRGGIRRYVKRRASRILPPYYAALALSLLLIGLQVISEPLRSELLPHAGAFPAIGTHLLLLHNLSPHTSGAIDPPLWSVATEGQIYLLFPLVLLPLWRRFGIGAVVVIGFLVGLAPHYLLGALDSMAPWYLGLFTLGMLGAVINFSRLPHLRRWRDRMPWGRLSVVLLSAFLAFGLLRANWYSRHFWLADPIVGLAAMSFMIHCTLQMQRGAGSVSSSVLRLLNSRYVILLGTFSYSLYLVHYPVLEALICVLQRSHPSHGLSVLITLFVFVPLTTSLCYLFYLACERRFVVENRRQ